MNAPARKSPLQTGMTNLLPIGGEYPKMLYRATEEKKRFVQTTQPDGEPKTWLVINRFNGLLCDTIVADSLDDAETLAADGWDVSPEAAHGVVSGIVVATSAKDDRIAELEALLAARSGDVAIASSSPPHVEQRRGPGRPPRVADEQQSE